MISLIKCLIYFLLTSTFLLSFTLSQGNFNTNDYYSQSKLKNYFQKVCKCSKLKDCTTMLDILKKVPLTDWLTQSLRKSSCGFSNTHEPMVCCPYNNDDNIFLHKILETDLPTNRFGLPKFRKLTTTTTTTSEKPWIWDRLKVDSRSSTTNEINHQNISVKKNDQYKYRFDDYLDFDNIDYNENLIDFEDPNTYKNCPPSFYNDFNEYNNINKPKFLPQSNYWNNGPDNTWNNNNIHRFPPYPLTPPPPPQHHNNFPHEFPHHYPHPVPNQHHHHGHYDYHFNHQQHYPKLPNLNRPWPKIPFPTIKTSQIPKFLTNNNNNDDADKFSIKPKENNLNDKRKLVNTKNCGLSVSTRIIGGIDSVQGQFPWMARIAYRNRSSQTISYRCAGSLINDRYIVTAAHCVTNLVETLEVSHIRIGEQFKTRNINCDNDAIGCLIPQDYQIEQIIPHLNYDTPKYANDIALIRMIQTSNIPIVTPICLPMAEFSDVDKNLIGEIGTVAGWQSNVAGSAPSMQWVQLPIVNTTECSISYARFSVNSRFPIVISSSQICAQGTEKADACQGDSGGPLMRESVKNDLRYTLIGLVSFGPRTCGISNYPGVYTRVSSYVNWILNNMIE